jgi:hypothetical protein
MRAGSQPPFPLESSISQESLDAMCASAETALYDAGRWLSPEWGLTDALVERAWSLAALGPELARSWVRPDLDRPDCLASHAILDVMRANQGRFDYVWRLRHEWVEAHKLGGTPKPATERVGRLLVWFPWDSFLDEGPFGASSGFFDRDDQPPFATWIFYCAASRTRLPVLHPEAQAQECDLEALCAFVPESLCDLVEYAISFAVPGCHELLPRGMPVRGAVEFVLSRCGYR